MTLKEANNQIGKPVRVKGTRGITPMVLLSVKRSLYLIGVVQVRYQHRDWETNEFPLSDLAPPFRGRG